jgi:transaldolase/glucose-6-phosphate isomerase
MTGNATGNPLKTLETLGQSVWLDYIRRDLMVSGQLKRLIDEDGLRGMTSNPSIFEQAIGGSRDYDDDIRSLALQGKSVGDVYDALSQHDVQMAADIFRPLYDETYGRDGYVSLEVNPHLAHDTAGTIKEAQRLWVALDRPNVFIKVPATLEGLPVITRLIHEGINVNVTLLFGIPRYRQVVDAYLAGIRSRLAQGKPVTKVASVASFFISRIDVLVDPLLEKQVALGGPTGDIAQKMLGQVAIASAKSAYRIYQDVFEGETFTSLADKGATTQRLLWASTSTKDPAYSDVKYVESLVGRHTVDTVPLETLDKYRDHGKPENRIERDINQALWTLDRLPELSISIDDLTQQLENEGVEKFSQAYDKLMATLKTAMRP